MVDEPLFGIGAYHEAGDAYAVSVLVHHGRRHVVVITAPVVPGDEDGARFPVRAFHHRVNEAGDIRHAQPAPAPESGMFAQGAAEIGSDPAYLGQVA